MSKTYKLSMLFSIIVNMVKGEKAKVVFSATHASISIMLEGLAFVGLMKQFVVSLLLLRMLPNVRGSSLPTVLSTIGA